MEGKVVYMLSKKFIIKYQERGYLFTKYKSVFADSEEEALKTFNKVMGDRYTAVSIEEVK